MLAISLKIYTTRDKYIYNNNNNDNCQQKNDVNNHDLDSNDDNNLDDKIIKEYCEYELIIKNEMMLNNKRENNKYYSSP